MFTRDPITGAMGIIAATGDIDGSPLRFQRMFYKARRSIGRRLADVRSCLLLTNFVEKVRFCQRTNFLRRADALVRELRGGPPHQSDFQCVGFAGSL